jgi:predicted cobalt transporter CbtA
MNNEGSTRKYIWITLAIIATGLTAFGLVILVLRSGGLVRVLAIILAIAVLYAGYESVRAINRK